MLDNEEGLISLIDMITRTCNNYINNTKPWWWLRDTVFYMYITDKDIYDEN
jgi:hypothetical protein